MARSRAPYTGACEMEEAHASLCAFLADLHDQADAFERMHHPRSELVRKVMADLKVRLVSQAAVVYYDAELQQKSGG
jgi:hypothetical protein